MQLGSGRDRVRGWPDIYERCCFYVRCFAVGIEKVLHKTRSGDFSKLICRFLIAWAHL
ncbi:hypothetical protein HEB94_010035 [Actinopolymorpha pittospori]|uniref:Uncharacterized protein n=1 Tax=Actinopolymorpha pittospori TaxID=648752 RepID=A0A927RE58_9ACTN|nr:hypothetical protein [Actinopolymorpha pittospori]